MHHRRFLEQDFGLISPMRISASEYADLPLIPLVPLGLERHGWLMPRLVRLREMNRDDRILLLERSDRWQALHGVPLFCALFQSAVNATKLRTHWNAVAIARTPTLKAWLRLHDPLIFRHLAWLSGPEQLTFYMGPIDCWTWFDPLARNWRALERPVLAEGVSPQSFTPIHLDSIDLLEVVNVCLRALVREGAVDPLDDQDARRLLAHARVARDAGLVDLNDRCHYARLGFRYGPDFQRWPETVECLQRAAMGEISFIGAAARHARLTLSESE